MRARRRRAAYLYLAGQPRADCPGRRGAGRGGRLLRPSPRTARSDHRPDARHPRTLRPGGGWGTGGDAPRAVTQSASASDWGPHRPEIRASRRCSSRWRSGAPLAWSVLLYRGSTGPGRAHAQRASSTKNSRSRVDIRFVAAQLRRRLRENPGRERALFGALLGAQSTTAYAQDRGQWFRGEQRCTETLLPETRWVTISPTAQAKLSPACSMSRELLTRSADDACRWCRRGA
jgi:hypothetical protein